MTFLSLNDMIASLAMMAPRRGELRRVLKKSGSLYFHRAALVVAGTFSACTDRSGTAKDDTGAPISNAEVKWSWSEFSLPPQGGRLHEGSTNTNPTGQFTFERTRHIVFFRVTEPRHYPTSASIRTKKQQVHL